MKKCEAEPIVRHLISEWAATNRIQSGQTQDPNFPEFWRYLNEVAPNAAQFQSDMSAFEDVELWFDEHFGLTWKR